MRHARTLTSHAKPQDRRRAMPYVAGAGVLLLALAPAAAFVAHASTARTSSDEAARRAANLEVLPTITAPPTPAGAKPVPAARAKPTSKRHARASVPASFAFTGSGWGHGVGMSQVGALGMATEGASATKILKHFYTGVQVQPVRDNVQLAVNIAHQAHRITLRTEALAAHGGALSLTAKTSSKAVHLSGGPGQTWTATSTSHGITVRRAGSRVATHVRELDVVWSGTTSPPRHVAHGYKRHAATALHVGAVGGSLDGASHLYRYGRLTLFSHGGGSGHIEAVNTLSLHNEYLRGLGEVPSSWPAAALQAQVDAARSYALVKYQHGIHSVCDCDIDAGGGPWLDQNFVGYSKQTSADGNLWKTAVSATNRGHDRGEAVTYHGAVAQTFYFSSSGGRTENAVDIWGTAVPYLRSVDDHWSTETKYNPTYATWGPAVVSEATVAAAFHLPNVTTIRFSRYSGGAVHRAIAVSRSGAKRSLSGAALARKLQLTSIWIHTVRAGSA